jgi:hypothetical protein
MSNSQENIQINGKQPEKFDLWDEDEAETKKEEAMEEEQEERQTLANWTIVDKRDGKHYTVFGTVEIFEGSLLFYNEQDDPVGFFPTDTFFAFREDAFFDEEDDDDNTDVG